MIRVRLFMYTSSYTSLGGYDRLQTLFPASSGFLAVRFQKYNAANGLLLTRTRAPAARADLINESSCSVPKRHKAFNRSGLISGQAREVCLHQYGSSSVDASLA
ncbi:hypothetical protein AMELA_G00000420 [Ameiurus melas]|uniref:Uncharacterized protein n=1 Tax=Ameiurus melas TaxID=219545 RepID=A0A7J6BEI8_AMEME|nr:hypothetical protein AMELA_G00000420 [Ameiurus melas]